MSARFIWYLYIRICERKEVQIDVPVDQLDKNISYENKQIVK